MMQYDQGILIVGGYGMVGGKAAELLVGGEIAPVRIAGRNGTKAKKLADALGCEWAVLDMEQPESWSAALEGMRLVLVCLDQENTEFPEAVLSSGRLYMDISGGDEFFRPVERLDKFARDHRGSAVLSVGVTPGLSNLLVKTCAEKLDYARHARIGVLLGLGDTHGKAAMTWAVDRLAAVNNRPAERTDIAFGPGRETQPAYRFDIADQHVVRRTLGLEADTWLAFDSPFLTRLTFWLAPFLSERAWLPRLLIWMFSYIRIGSDRWALSITVSGTQSGQPMNAHAFFEGRREADFTALFAVALIGQILSNPPQPGVYHVEQVADGPKIYDALTGAGGQFTLSQSPYGQQ